MGARSYNRERDKKRVAAFGNIGILTTVCSGASCGIVERARGSVVASPAAVAALGSASVCRLGDRGVAPALSAAVDGGLGGRGGAHCGVCESGSASVRARAMGWVGENGKLSG